MRLALFLIGVSAFGQLAITGPSSAKQGDAPSYSASGGTAPYTFSMIAGSVGSITSGGNYTVPVVTPKSAPGGCQALPNNHIFNTVMSAVPVDARTNGGGTNNSVWMASLVAASNTSIRYEIDAPINYVNSTDPTTTMVFNFGAPTAGYNIPPFPNLRSENGYALYGYNVAGTDHHNLIEAKDICQMQEMYQQYPAGWVVGCPTCTSQQGTKYPLNAFAMPPFGVDAAGMPLYPLYLKITELKAGAINHLLRMTLCPGCFDTPSNQWPAQTHTAGTPNTAYMPYGTILRLKAGFSFGAFDAACSSMTCQAYVNTLITQLKTYGLIVADGGTTGAISVMYDSPITPDIFVGGDTTGAFAEILNRIGLNATNFDVLNVTSLQTSASGTGTDLTWGEVKYNNGSVTPSTFALVKVTDNVGATATKSIALQGIAVGVPQRTEVFLAGTAATQMTAWVSGATNSAYTCSLSPSGGDNGTVTSGCLYSPPATAAGRTNTVLTFTATADGATTATQDIVIFPFTSLSTARFNNGDIADYTDGGGNLWYADLKTSNPPLWETSYSYNLGAQAWTNAGQSPRIYDRINGNGGDIYQRLHLPNGTYTLTLNFADSETAINQRNSSIDSQGIVNIARFDYFTEAGAQFAAFSKQYTVAVSDGTLQFVVRDLGVPPTFTNGCCNGNLYNQGFAAYLSGFSLTQTGTSVPGTKITGQFTGSGRVIIH